MLEHRDEGFDPKGHNPEKTITQLEARILATGVQLQASGIDWWQALQMIKALEEREMIKGRERARVYSELASLQRDGLVRARWKLPKNTEERIAREFQVTEDGNKVRNKVSVTSASINLAPKFIPATEPI